MGCWNGTCSLTNMPILAGEEVVFFFIKNKAKPQGNSFCYHHEAAEPLTLPMEGVYDDYGAVENIKEDIALDFNTMVLKDYLFHNEDKHDFKYGVQEDGLKEHPDTYEVIYEDFNMESFTKHVERSSCDQAKMNDIILLLVKKPIFFEMIEKYRTQKNWFGSPLKWFNDAVSAYESGRNLSKEEKYEKFFIPRFEIFNYYPFKRYLIPFMDKLNDVNWEIFKKHLERFYLYDGLIPSLRMIYSPGSGSGSQSDETDVYRHLFEICLDECERMKTQYDDEYEEEYDQDE